MCSRYIEKFLLQIFFTMTLEYVGVFKGSFKFTSLFTDKSPLQNVFKDLFDNRLTQYLDAAKDAMTKAAG